MILVFGYNNYYPGGGVNDLLWCGEEIQNFIDDINTDEELVKEIKSYDYVDLINTNNMKEVHSVKLGEDNTVEIRETDLPPYAYFYNRPS